VGDGEEDDATHLLKHRVGRRLKRSVRPTLLRKASQRTRVPLELNRARVAATDLFQGRNGVTAEGRDDGLDGGLDLGDEGGFGGGKEGGEEGSDGVEDRFEDLVGEDADEL
jgi:hypothetical protein